MADTVVIKQSKCTSCGDLVYPKPGGGWMCPKCGASADDDGDSAATIPPSRQGFSKLNEAGTVLLDQKQPEPKRFGASRRGSMAVGPSVNAGPGPDRRQGQRFGSSLGVKPIKNTAGVFSTDVEGWVGRVLGDKYRLEQKIGKGAMGTVFRATHVVLGKEVAIKVLEPALAKDPTVASRFLQEARFAAQISDPGIVEVSDFGQADGSVYFAMEYLRGETLSEHLASAGRINPSDAVEIISSVANSVAAAHAKGVIHRDLKPANIFLSSGPAGSRAVKVLDFGLSKALHGSKVAEATLPGLVCGSPAYMSPEQAQGRPVDPRSDVYSLGIVLYQVVSGNVPFSADKSMVVMQMHVTEPPPPIRDVAIPEVLRKALFRALEKKPENRFPTMEEFSRALQAAKNEMVPPKALSKSSKKEGSVLSADAGDASYAKSINGKKASQSKKASSSKKAEKAKKPDIESDEDEDESDASAVSQVVSPPSDNRIFIWVAVCAGAVLLAALAVFGIIWINKIEADKRHKLQEAAVAKLETKVDPIPPTPQAVADSGGLDPTIDQIAKPVDDKPVSPSKYINNDSERRPAPRRHEPRSSAHRSNEPRPVAVDPNAPKGDLVLTSKSDGVSAEVAGQKIMISKDVPRPVKVPIGKATVQFSRSDPAAKCTIVVDIAEGDSGRRSLVFGADGVVKDLQAGTQTPCQK